MLVELHRLDYAGWTSLVGLCWLNYIGWIGPNTRQVVTAQMSTVVVGTHVNMLGTHGLGDAFTSSP